MSKLLFTDVDWTMDTIRKTWEVIDHIARDKYGLDYFEPQIEIITADQALHYMTMGALPFNYPHWSLGKAEEAFRQEYAKGKMNIAYETIINSDPMICYISETNSMLMQTMVLAHAIVGHGSFFKHNECFKLWTHPKNILPYARFARNYVEQCEEKYGRPAVERILDAAHALESIGVDRHKRSPTKKKAELDQLQRERAAYEDSIYREIWNTIPSVKKVEKAKDTHSDLFPEENVLYFIEKNAPNLEEWQRELIHIVRTFAQYFYPQRQCKLMHEGWASFWHYTILTDLYEEGYITDGHYLEFLSYHTAVAYQPEPYSWTMDDDKYRKHYKFVSSINPYALGFDMFSKIRQVCEKPTEQDYKEFPTIADTPWVETCREIMETYIDESFMYQFLGSETIEKFHFAIVDVKNTPKEYRFTIQEDANRDRLGKMRKYVSDEYNISYGLPSVEVVDYDSTGDRSLTLKHNPTYGMALDRKQLNGVMKYLHKLWGHPVRLKTIDADGVHFTLKREHL